MEPSGPQSDCSVLWTVTGSDGSDSFSLKRRRPASFFFFFPPKWCRSEQLQHIFFYPPIRRRFASLKIPLLKPSFLISQSLFWNLKITRLCLSQILTLSSLNLSLAPSHLILSPSRRRTVAAHPLSLAPSHFALRSSVTLSSPSQPRSQCCCRRRSSAQVLIIFLFCRVAVNVFSFFFWNFFFFGFIPS